jgi:purine-nucleoside phosphorylase
VSTGLFERATEAAAFLRRRISATPKIAVVLGSGLGGIASLVEDPVTVPYADIPNFPQSTVEGHSGQLVVGKLHGIPLAIMQGRVHGYEGYTPEQVTFPMRVLGCMGITTVIVTNAAGGIRRDLRQGDLVLISDHINFTNSNPLIGPNDPRLGARFFDMTEAYSLRLRTLAETVADKAGFSIPQGVYICVNGPSYETPAEIRAFRTMGADLVGMSTVHEVIIARHMSLEVLGISCVTNMAAGVLDEKIHHEEVMDTGRRVQERLGNLIAALLPEISAKSKSAEQ